ncbi:MAG: ATP-grasp domain-containing protein [Nanoarchaeota archaeon]
MKKLVIGYLYNGRGLGEDEILFRKIAKKKDIDTVLINTSLGYTDDELKEEIKKCNIIYNSSGDDFVIETEKTIEELGKKIIESSKSYYYVEDKWMFYLKCKEHKIKTPDTILLAQDITYTKKELRNFNKWPVIIKKVNGCMGEFVEKADNINEAEKIIKKLWKKSNEKDPLIAQEFIRSPSYRVTLIGGKIVQTAIKENIGWKATGVYAKKIKKFNIDKKIKLIIDKLNKFTDIQICGIDFLRKDGEWIALEVNSAPGLDFFESERKEMIEKVIELLVKLAKKD